jgi:hypothetical protein
VQEETVRVEENVNAINKNRINIFFIIAEIRVLLEPYIHDSYLK